MITMRYRKHKKKCRKRKSKCDFCHWQPTCERKIRDNCKSFMNVIETKHIPVKTKKALEIQEPVKSKDITIFKYYCITVVIIILAYILTSGGLI